jgi:hypothetical protein
MIPVTYATAKHAFKGSAVGGFKDSTTKKIVKNNRCYELYFKERLS